MPTLAEIQTCVNNLTTSSPKEDFTTLAAQAADATTHAEFSVQSITNLEDLNTSSLPDGSMVYVIDLARFAVKSGKDWVTVDGKMIRNDGDIGELWIWGSLTSTCSPVTIIGGGTTWCQTSSASAIKTDGTLWTLGACRATACAGTDWCQASQRSAIKTNGTLWTWGTNTGGVLGDNTTTDRVSPGTTAGGGTTWCQVSMMTFLSPTPHMAAVKTDGTLWTWGGNGLGKLGDNSTTSRSSPGTTAGGGTNWCQVSLAVSSSAAIKTDGTLWTWGCNTSGILGDNTTVSRSSPGTTSGGGTDWCRAGIGNSFSAAIKTNGTLWTWGTNGFGSLGTGNTTNRSSPGTTVGGGTNWCQNTSNSLDGFAIKTDGTLWVWGFGSFGSLGIGSATSQLSPINVAGGGNAWCQVCVFGNSAAAIKSF